MCVYRQAPRDEVSEEPCSPLSLRQNGPVCATVPAGEFALMVLDKHGTVCQCDAAAARLFAAGAQQLIGKPVGELIPDMPLKPDTPGYNVAYAAFWASEACGREFRGRDGRGRAVCLELSLAGLAPEGGHQILLRLRQAGGVIEHVPTAFEATPGFPGGEAGWRIGHELRCRPQSRSPAPTRAG